VNVELRGIREFGERERVVSSLKFGSYIVGERRTKRREKMMRRQRSRGG